MVLIFSVIMYSVISLILFKNNNDKIILFEKFSFYSYLITFLISFLFNPGIPKREYYSKKYLKEYKGDFKSIRTCDKCNITIPSSLNAGHCIYCNICIKGYDHHCPWIGKCVGKYTKIPFYLFLICTLLYIGSSILTLINYMKKSF